MEFQLLLALPNRSLCKEFIKKRCEFVEKREIERIRLETRFIRIKEGTTRTGEGEQEEEMKRPKEEKKRCKSCNSKLPLFFSTPFVCSLCKVGYSCKKCWCLKEQVSLCKECFNLLTPPSPTTTTMVSNGNSLLLLEDYNKFTAIKKRIESLLFQFSTTDKSGTRNEILSLFSKFEELKLHLEQSLSSLSKVIATNFGHFCLLFYQQYKFTLKYQNCLVGENEGGGGGGEEEDNAATRTVVIQTEQRAIFEQQANYLRKEINKAIKKGKLEDALLLRENLAELEIQLSSNAT